MQIECSGLAIHAKEYEISDMHDKEAKNMFEELISYEGMDSSDLTGNKIRAIGINDGIEKTLRIYKKTININKIMLCRNVISRVVSKWRMPINGTFETQYPG